MGVEFLGVKGGGWVGGWLGGRVDGCWICWGDGEGAGEGRGQGRAGGGGWPHYQGDLEDRAAVSVSACQGCAACLGVPLRNLRSTCTASQGTSLLHTGCC